MDIHQRPPSCTELLPSDQEHILHDDEIGAHFNIMPDKHVCETFRLRKFILQPAYAEALFDRSYASDMDASPNHVTMTVLPLLTQRLFYAWCCYKLGLLYEPRGPELLKVWPTLLKLDYPRLLRSTHDLRYRIEVLRFTKVKEKRYAVEISGSIDGVLGVHAEGHVIVL